jgi:hypothetical protein
MIRKIQGAKLLFTPAIIKKDERITLICHIVYRRVAGGPPNRREKEL